MHRSAESSRVPANTCVHTLCPGISMDTEVLAALKKGNPLKLHELLLAKDIDVNARDANRRTLLHHAVNQSKSEVVKFLLDNGGDVLLANDKNNTPLHVAAARNDLTTTSVLLENAPPEKLRELLNARTSGKGSAALHVAAADGHYELAMILLAFGANFEISNSEAKRPVDLVEEEGSPLRDLLNLVEASFQRARSGSRELLCDLEYSAAAEFASVCNCRDNEGRTIVQLLVLNEHYELAESLINLRGTQPRKHCPMADEDRKEEVDRLAKVAEEFTRFWREKWNSMDLYVEEVCRKTEKNFMAKHVLEQGSYSLERALRVVRACRAFEGGRSIVGDPNVRTVEEVLEAIGFEAEHIGVEYRHTEYDEMAEFFASKGQGAKYYEMLHSPQKRDVRSFIDLMNATIDTPIDQFLQTIYTLRLFDAVRSDDVAAARKLLFHNAYSNACDAAMRTPLTIAAARGNEEMINLLLEYDARVNVEGKITPLHTAVDSGSSKIVELLLRQVPVEELPELIDRQSYQQKLTALHCAARRGFFEIVKSLLRHGATYCLLDENGEMPMDTAKDAEVRKLLGLIDECFDGARRGKVDFLRTLEDLERGELLAATRTRDRDGNTLAAVAAAAEANSAADEISRMVKRATD